MRMQGWRGLMVAPVCAQTVIMYVMRARLPSSLQLCRQTGVFFCTKPDRFPIKAAAPSATARRRGGLSLPALA